MDPLDRVLLTVFLVKDLPLLLMGIPNVGVSLLLILSLKMEKKRLFSHLVIDYLYQRRAKDEVSF
jgi:hypothetical protein